MAENPKYLWMNGKVVPWAEGTVHVSSEAFLRGASVFEGMRAYWNESEQDLYIFKTKQHLRRLRQSMKIMRMSLRFSDDEIASGFVDLLSANKFKDGVHFRPVVYFDEGEAYAWKQEDIGTGMVVLAYSRPHSPLIKKGIRSCTSTWRRNSDLASPSRVKASANYHNSRFAHVEARLNGFGPPIMLNDRGEVAESPGSTFMMVRDGTVITAPVSADILEGITRTTLISLFRDELKIPVIEREIDRTEVYIADEAFFCGSGVEIQPIVSVDHYDIGDGNIGPISKKIQDLYFSIARGEHTKYRDWLLPVYKGQEKRAAKSVA